ncbi:C2H2 transcription factor (Egr2), putative [Talaromyces stipitatus ATCC 10500]|uniref:C2H2 transcription factor (Egr2), putative n=1 Tax=Talaromyces stipitatus (strain ATCC 10500 / CBS 375.48 / QM 6759 / NRRL 1006) TaxID=441959 RepID=B8LW37_TALSN|nr:C2H2 transcription factor (Egr2), putative [Talaromyces stipitatus ATCC 10500]EED24065.1 C2H2 transcription factor (Egr2), putative [Talaromyces stipitatus ATCC 10500]
MPSILNNDDNPAFAVRRAVDTPTYKPPYESSYRKVEYAPTQPSWAAHHTHQLPTTSYPTPPSTYYTSDAGSSPYSSNHHQHLHHHHPPQHGALTYQHHRTPSIQSNSDLSSQSISSPSGAAFYNPPPTTETAKPAKKNKYPCPYAASHACTATFTTSGHAARHGKKHTVCNKAFTRKDNMKQHCRTHRVSDNEAASPTTSEL